MTDTSISATTQCALIEQHLLSGRPITPIEALNLYGCFRLGARIWDLKEKGLNIVTEMVRNGRKSYAMYRLASIDPVIVLCLGLTFSYIIIITIAAFKFYKLAKNHAAWRLGQQSNSSKNQSI